MAYFPFMIQLDDKKCLIAGGGKVALRKAEMMLSFGADVKIIAPEICDEILGLEIANDRLKLKKRKIKPDDIDICDVVIMATNDSQVNKEIASLCKEKRILVNVVDVKEDCGFYFPAVIRQDDVVISVSTGGNSPLLASYIKRDIKENIRNDYGKIAKDMGEIRDSIIAGSSEEADRKEIFKRELTKRIDGEKSDLKDDCNYCGNTIDMRNNDIRIGTRGSELALIQTNMVIDELKKKHPEYNYKKVILTTKGDKKTNVPITSFGGKAVFVEEIEQALIDGTIDIAVHSAKDMPNPCKEGLTIAGTLKRACPKDVLIYKKGRVFNPDDKFTIGTGSLRRRCQIKEIYPNAECLELRGNIGTRLDKLKEDKYDAIILAAAGIERQELARDSGLEYRYLTIDEMIPAAGQAIIAIETKEASKASKLVADISDVDSYKNLEVERAVLTKLNAGCHEPIGVWSDIKDDKLEIRLVTDTEKGVVRKIVQGDSDRWKELVEKLCE